MRRVVIAILALAIAAPATCAAAPGGHALKRYVMRVQGQIGTYRKLLHRVEALVAEEEHVNVDPVVDQFNELSDKFEDLAARWQAVNAPHGLRLRHRGMGRVFVLFADAYRIHAAALFTRHTDEILAARPKVEAKLRSAAYLQQRWAAALQGALIRAKLRVPGWLHRMAIGR